MFLESPASFMADFGSPVIFGAYRTMALFDQPDKEILRGRAQSTGYMITYPATDLVGLGNESTVLIGITPGWIFDPTGRLQFIGPCPDRADSGTFKVLGTPSLLDDGGFLEARLERIS